jgi:hypothetical protein
MEVRLVRNKLKFRLIPNRSLVQQRDSDRHLSTVHVVWLTWSQGNSRIISSLNLQRLPKTPSRDLSRSSSDCALFAATVSISSQTLSPSPINQFLLLCGPTVQEEGHSTRDSTFGCRAGVVDKREGSLFGPSECLDPDGHFQHYFLFESAIYPRLSKIEIKITV